MSASAETVTASINYLRPIDSNGLVALGEKGKSTPDAVVTLKAKTVCEGQFRMQTYVRDLQPLLIDEPPHLLVRIPGHRGHPFRLIVGSDSD